MPASIGVNLRVTGHCRQGGRKYMEDFFSVAYQQTEDERDLEYAFFGIYDGHGGAEAAAFAKEHLMETIVKQKNFWSDNDGDVLRAIKDGYIATHYAMWKEQEKWPKTASGLPSTAGTTASVAFIRRGKIYIGHVGDSGIILGYQEPGCPEWKAKPLTKEHKPESALEMSRIESCGGKVVLKSGVPRVVWNRPRIGHQGPVRRSTPIDEIPFLAVARSLGDLWSYNSQLDEFVVSPDPDCTVIPIDTSTFRCLIFGTDGLYNMLSPQMAVHIVQQAERHNENAALSDDPNKVGWLNPSKCLVEKALERWSTTKMRADNTSVVTLMLDPPGPPRAQVLKNKKKNNAYPDSGLKIVTRYQHVDGKTTKDFEEKEKEIQKVPEKEEEVPKVSLKDATNSNVDEGLQKETAEKDVEVKDVEKVEEVKTSVVENDVFFKSTTNLNDIDLDFMQKTRESLSYDVRKPTSDSEDVNSCCLSSSIDHEVSKSTNSSENIQIHEISSSSNDNFEIEEETVNSQNKSETYSIEVHKMNKVQTRTTTNQNIKLKNKSPKKEESQNETDPKNGQGPSRPSQEEPVPKSNIRDSLRSTTSAKLKENAWLRGRKRRLINSGSGEIQIRDIVPRKRIKPNSSLPVIIKKEQNSDVDSSKRVETSRKCPRLITPVLKKANPKQKLLSVNKVVLRQKIKVLQSLITSRSSGILEKNKPKINFNNNNNNNKKNNTTKDEQDAIFKRKVFKKVPSVSKSFSTVKAVTRSHSRLQQQQQLQGEKMRPEKVKKVTKTVRKVNNKKSATLKKLATKAIICTSQKKMTRSSNSALLRRSSRRIATLERTTQRCNCC